MKRLTSVFFGAFLASGFGLMAEDDLNVTILSLEANLLTTEQFSVSGEFAQYDFPGVDTAFDWTFTTPGDAVYQLQGKASSETDVFGWKQVSVTPAEAMWYMAYIGDWDNDGDSRFDWILVGSGFNAVYKLSGVSASGNFAYSAPMDISYSLSGDKGTIIFTDDNTPQLNVSFPTGGDSLVDVAQSNGSGYMHYYGTALDALSKISGDTGSGLFEIGYNGENVERYEIGNYKVVYTNNSNGTADMTLYVDDLSVLQLSGVALRAQISKEEYELLMAEAGGNMMQAAIILRDRAVTFFAGGVCDRNDARYNPELCTRMFEQAYNLLLRVNEQIKPDLEVVAQNVQSSSSSSSSTGGVVTIDIIGFYKTLGDQFDGFYSEYMLCPQTYTEKSYLNIYEPYYINCQYKENTLYSASANGIEAVDTTARFNVTFSNGEVRMSYSNNSLQLSGTKAANGAYRYFAAYSGEWASRVPEYSTMINNIDDPAYIYTYTEYKAGVREYAATYTLNGEMIRFCKYDAAGQLYDWCEPEF